MKYVNNTYTTKTFYGVEFKPGEEKEVPGYINADGFFRTDIFEIPKVESTEVQPEPKASEQAVEAEAPKEVESEPKTTTRGRKSKTIENETEGE